MSRYIIKRPTSVGALSRGKDYSVRDLGTSHAGYTDLLKKELGVSLDASGGQTRWTQIHELSHVKHSKWSPKRIAQRMAKRGITLTQTSILAAEDARINELALRAVPDAHKGFVLEMAEEHTRRDIEGYVASHASPECVRDRIRAACDPVQVATIDKELAKLKAMPARQLSVARVTVELARVLDALKSGKPSSSSDGEAGKEKSESMDGEPSAGKSAGSDKENGPDTDTDEPADDGDKDDTDDGDEASDDGAGDDGDGGDGEDDGPGGGKAAEDDVDQDEGTKDADDDADDDTDDAKMFGKPDAKGSPHTDHKPGSGRGTKWLIPEVVEPPLRVPLRGGNYQVATAETGTTLRWTSLHRIVTDGVVFRRARRKPGALQRGTVLIDASGSMSLSDEIIEKMVEMLPYATVAIYSGQPSNWFGKSEAHIVVVARNGKRVTTISDRAEVPRAGGNTCDGPALLWLSRQPGPRLWICDGYVTGSTEGSNSQLDGECAAIMEAAGIVQVTGDNVYRPKKLVATRTMIQTTVRLDPATIELQLGAVLKEIERGIV